MISNYVEEIAILIQELGGGRLSGIFNLREMGDNLLNQSQVDLSQP